MIPIGNLIGKLLFPRRAKFVENLASACVTAVRQIEHFDSSVKSVCLTWLAVVPHTYITELLLKSWVDYRRFVPIFFGSSIDDAQRCFHATQAYYLRHLLQLTKQAPEYGKFDANTIKHNVRTHMVSGEEIVLMAEDFEQAILNMSCPEDFFMCYIERLLVIQYPDEAARDRTLSSLWLDSQALLWLSIFTVETINRAKYVDEESGDLTDR